MRTSQFCNLSHLSIGRGEIVKNDHQEKINVILGLGDKEMYKVGIFNKESKYNNKLVYFKAAKTYSTKYGALIIFSENIIDGMDESGVKNDTQKNFLFLKISDFSKFSKINLKVKRKKIHRFTAQEYLATWSESSKIDSDKIKKQFEKANKVIVNNFMLKYYSLKKKLCEGHPNPQNILTSIMKEDRHVIKPNKKIIGKNGKSALYTQFFDINSTILLPEIKKSHKVEKKKHYKEMNHQEQHDHLTEEIAKNIIEQALVTNKQLQTISNDASSDKYSDTHFFQKVSSESEEFNLNKPQVLSSIEEEKIQSYSVDELSVEDYDEKGNIIMTNLTKSIEKLGRSILEKPESGKSIESDLSDLTKTMSQIRESIIDQIRSSSSQKSNKSLKQKPNIVTRSASTGLQNGTSSTTILDNQSVVDIINFCNQEQSDKKSTEDSSKIKSSIEDIKSESQQRSYETSPTSMTHQIVDSKLTDSTSQGSIQKSLIEEIKSIISKSISGESSGDATISEIENVIESAKTSPEYLASSSVKSLIEDLESIRDILSQQEISKSTTNQTGKSASETREGTNLIISSDITSSESKKVFVEQELKSSAESLIISMNKKIESLELSISLSDDVTEKRYEITELTFSKHGDSNREIYLESNSKSSKQMLSEESKFSSKSKLSSPTKLESLDSSEHKLKDSSQINTSVTVLSELNAQKSTNSLKNVDINSLDPQNTVEIIVPPKKVKDDVKELAEDKPKEHVKELAKVKTKIHVKELAGDKTKEHVKELAKVKTKIHVKELAGDKPKEHVKELGKVKTKIHEKELAESTSNISKEKSKSKKIRNESDKKDINLKKQQKDDQSLKKDTIQKITKKIKGKGKLSDIGKETILESKMIEKKDEKTSDLIEDKSISDNKSENKKISSKSSSKKSPEISEQQNSENIISQSSSKSTAQKSREASILDAQKSPFEESEEKSMVNLGSDVKSNVDLEPEMSFIRIESDHESETDVVSGAYIQPEMELFYNKSRKKSKIEMKQDAELKRKSINKEINAKKREMATKKKHEQSMAKQEQRLEMLKKQQLENEMEETMQHELNERLKNKELEALRKEEEDEKQIRKREELLLANERQKNKQKELLAKEKKAYYKRIQKIKQDQEEEERQRIEKEKMLKFEEELKLEKEKLMLKAMEESEYMKYMYDKEQENILRLKREEQERLVLENLERIVQLEKERKEKERQRQVEIVIARNRFLTNVRNQDICGKYSMEITRAFIYSYFELLQWVSECDETKLDINFMED